MKFTGERFIPAETLLKDEIAYEHLHRYYAIAPLLTGKSVLDIACGEGYGSAIIAKHASMVLGVDIDKECILWASRQYLETNHNLRFQTGSAAAIPCDDHLFDVVVSFETIEHLDIAAQHIFLKEITRVLRPGGILVMSTPDKQNYSERFSHQNSFHLHEFHRDEFTGFIKRYFSHASFFEQGFEIVSVISNYETEQKDSIRLCKPENAPSDAAPSRKYVIAISSDEPLPESFTSFASVIVNVNKDYLTVMNRLIEMDKEIRSLGEWGRTMEKDLEAREANVKKKNPDENLDKDQLLQKLNEKDMIAEELNQKLHQLHHETDGLKGRLAEIYDSEGYKLLSVYYKIKGKLLPESSARYKKLKKIVNKLRGKPHDEFADIQHKNLSGANVQIAPSLVSPTVSVQLPVFEFPTVSILIPAYNAWPMNYQCIRSIISNTQGVAYEVLLADDNSTDGTKDCTSLVSNLVHIRNEENFGFLKNCNNAAKKAKGKYILFLNNDTAVKPGWLSPLVEMMARDETIGMAGAKLVYPDGKLQESGGIIWNDASGWNYGHRQDPTAPEFNYVKEADYVSGACMMIRKDLWEKAGGFDERYIPAYSEDSDLAFAVRSFGYKVMYQPLSEVIHYEGYSHGTDTLPAEGSSNIKSYQTINNKKLFDKWKDVLQREHFPNGQEVYWARDRSRHKKTILFIDHYVPHIDKDAGSKTTFQYLELFTSLGLNIKFIGDNFFRHEPYTTMLQQLGIEVLYGAWYRDNWRKWVKDNSEKIDFIYINRPHIAIKYIDFLKQHTRAKILYYGHDLHFLREEARYRVEKDEKVLEVAAKWKQTELYLFKNVDVVLTASEDENKVISELDQSFRVETILPYFFREPARPVTDFTNRADMLFVGGFRHIPNIDAVQWFCNKVWPMVNNAIPSAKFLVVGSNPPDYIQALQSDSIQIKGFVSEQELYSIYGKARMAVIPLRYGAGVKGKTVEAMYQGLPVVSTAFGMEGMPGQYDSFFNPYDDAPSFAAELIRLYSDDNALKDLSIKQALYINEYFTEAAASAKMKSILDLR